MSAPVAGSSKSVWTEDSADPARGPEDGQSGWKKKWGTRKGARERERKERERERERGIIYTYTNKYWYAPKAAFFLHLTTKPLPRKRAAFFRMPTSMPTAIPRRIHRISSDLRS